ncbi:hypothetical protein ACJDU8_09835 [Clostridium sp. WILCCON 0269]|uniref:Uncharacterized protein n=1 Tax=Candidatus Clostridium eludens TaxID=3381663 RepID=A0ABW8SIP9_9CLOT
MKISKRIFVASVSALLLVVVFASGYMLQNNNKKQVEYLNASWIYNYRDIEEISQASDAIALVKVDGVSDTYTEQNILLSEFAVEVITPVYNTNANETFTIVMTGGETDEKIVEISDDPLLQAGDEILIFCKKNNDGTYRILSGPQGRLVYSNGKLNSLNSKSLDTSRAAKVNTDSNIMVTNADAEEMISQIKEYVGNQ